MTIRQILLDIPIERPPEYKRLIIRSEIKQALRYLKACYNYRGIDTYLRPETENNKTKEAINRLEFFLTIY